jgi:hypothetical protein
MYKLCWKIWVYDGKIDEYIAEIFMYKLGWKMWTWDENRWVMLLKFHVCITLENL